MKLACVVAALALVSIPLVACGGDDKESEPLSKSEYVKQGDEICAKSRAEFTKLFETDFPATPGAVPAFFGKAAPIFERQMSDLRTLDGPDADQAKVDRMLAVGDKSVADFEAASKDEQAGVKLFGEEGGKNSVAFDKQSKALGLNCDDDDEPTKKLDPDAFSAEKRAYVAKADAICAESAKRNGAIESRYFKSFPPELDGWAKFLPAIVESSRANAEKLKRLTPPAADKATIDALIARQEGVLDRFEQAGKTAATGDEDAFLASFKGVFADGDKIDKDLRAYGFQVCGPEED